jgi:dolichyl-phosphate-mannose-protein mannosyltransferase
MSSPAGVRHRGPKDKKRPTTPNPELSEKVQDVLAKVKPQTIVRQQPFTKPGSEWDYRLAITIITILAFVTRFWGISHPNQVVFDEVHFGKVRDERG